MIDHVSIAVRDLGRSAAFYQAVLATIGHTPLVERPHTIGFGKRYPEFWLNHRPAMAEVVPDTGVHVCLRAASTEAVDAFHRVALELGATCGGPPGIRPHRTGAYYAAFIRDHDGNKIEAVTFVEA